MTTPRKRPSVKNKKTVRPASRQADAAPEQQASQAGRSASSETAGASGALFPDVPAFSEPPTPRIPFAETDGAEFAGPADDFDLGDDPSPSRSSAPKKRRDSGGTTVSSGKKTRANTRTEAPKSRSEKMGGSKPSASGKHPKDAATRADSSSNRRNTSQSSSNARSGRLRKGIAIAVTILAAMAIIVGGFYAWNTYLRYNDAADIQGEWRTQDGTMTVVIDGANIRMPDLEYSYEIDTTAKRLTFHFSDLTGSGSYSFSEDRSTLSIVEGEGEEQTTTVLVKVSNDTQAQPHLLEKDEKAASGETEASDEDATEQSSGNGDASSDGDDGNASSDDEGTSDEEASSSDDSSSISAEGESEPESDASAEGV